MLKVRIVQSTSFKRLIDSVTSVVKKAAWECNEGGINFQHTYGASVSALQAFIPCSTFSSYDCSSDIIMKLDMEALKKIMSLLCIRVVMVIEEPRLLI